MAQVYTFELQEREHSETYTAHVERNGDGWIGWIQELPEVKCQKKTKKELLKTLKVELHDLLDVYEAEAEVWDKQFEEDVKTGKLDRFAEEALADFRAGKCEEI
jgi:hypothetical protein